MDELIARIPQANAYLLKFDELIQKASSSYDVETLSQRIHVLKPKFNAKSNLPSDKDIELTVSAVIHGVEVGGLAVLVEFLSLVTSGAIRLNASMGIALGNLAAVQNGSRFVERDLNRSFGRSQSETIEDRRADELEALFRRTKFLIDLHQVRMKIDRVFWIFPFTRKGFDFARLVAPEITLITHWGRGFSTEGKCSDEWVNEQGGVGITIELGQNGFGEEQIGTGLRVIKSAVGKIVNKQPETDSSTEPKGALYTWAEILSYPPTSERVLDEGWHNFKWVKAGERVGSFEGKDIVASVTGPILFPKYPDRRPDGTPIPIAPGSELMRIMKEITEDQLPKI